MSTITGRRATYGHALGIIMLDTVFPRLRGDIGNARTWPFPVSYRIVRDAIPDRVVRADPDPALIEPFIAAARDLEAQAVGAILTSCGYLAIYQETLADAVATPVFSSALLQVPAAASVMGPRRKVAIFSPVPTLTENHFNGAGWSSADIPVVVMAPSEGSELARVFPGNSPVGDVTRMEAEMEELARRTIATHPDVGAVVLECTNFPPFAQIVRLVTGLPVYDVYTLGMSAYLATKGTDFPRVL